VLGLLVKGRLGLALNKAPRGVLESFILCPTLI
jgi:hypothetical protein